MRLPKLPKVAHNPVAQLVLAVLVMVGGAALVGWWMVGIVLMLGGLMLGADAVLRDTAEPRQQFRTHEDVLERYRRAK